MSQDSDVAAKELLAGLRATLDPDPARAGQKYALLRRKLVSFFEWGGAASPDACAVETLIAAAWKLTDRAPAETLSAACLALARTILQKHTDAGDDGKDAPAAAPPPSVPDPFGDLEGLVFSFDAGLDALTDDNRDIVLAQYAGEQPQAIDARRALAGRLGLPLNQMRLRAYRTRSQLEQSVLQVPGPASGGAV